MRVLLLLSLPILIAACTRNVDDRKIYDHCFVDTECDDETTSGCFRILGETTTLGICSTYCGECPNGGVCSDAYETDDGGVGMPICIQACTAGTECPSGGFACRGGQCLPP